MPLATLQSDVHDRRHTLFCWAIGLEAALSFACPVLLLLIGTTFAGVSNHWQFRLVLLLGWGGIAGVARVLVILCTRVHHNRYAGLTLLGLSGGVAVALYMAWWAIRAGEVSAATIALGYLPLACAGHLVFLARRALFR